MSNLDLLEEACASLPHSTRAMFGGHGLFAPNGGMFAAVVPEDRIALKMAREEDRDAFLAEGAEPWTYQGRMTMRGWLVVPDSFYDDPRALEAWCRRAHATVAPKKAKAPKKGAPKQAASKGGAPKKSPARKEPVEKTSATAAVATTAAPGKAPAKAVAPKRAAQKKAAPKQAAPKETSATQQAPRKGRLPKGAGKRAGGPRG